MHESDQCADAQSEFPKYFPSTSVPKIIVNTTTNKTGYNFQIETLDVKYTNNSTSNYPSCFH